MPKGDVFGGLNVAKVLYSCSKTSFSQYEKIYGNGRKRTAKSHRKLNESQPLGAHGCDFSNLGWFHARSDFR